MSARPDDLLELASSVGDGADIDWGVHRTAAANAADDPALLEELEVIARIAQAHRLVAAFSSGNGGERRTWGHMTLGERLGSGSFGTVYRAHDPRLQRDVALKLYPATTRTGSSVDAMFTEGRMLARVRHPNVVVVHGVERHGDEIGLWLELIDGRTLADEVRSGGPLGFREAALVGQDVCRALAAVHQAGLVHRDVKAQNILRERGGRIVLMDFGLGRDVRREGDGEDAAGTPLYMAPELFDGAAASVASDLYSVGVLLFFLVTGDYPVAADDRDGLAHAHRDGRRRLLRDVRPDLPDAFVEVVERACAASPSQRYATAGTLQAALAAVTGLASANLALPADAPPQPAARALGRSAGWLGALAATVAAAVMLGVLWTRSSPSQAPQGATSAASVTQSTPSPAATPAGDPDEYQIKAAFHRVTSAGADALGPGSRVAPGDRLFLEVAASRPVHLYVVNQDDRGESYLLFPLPGQAVSNPLPGGAPRRLPGGADDTFWQVTSAGGREHFLVVASVEPLAALESVLARLPRAQAGRAVTTAAPLSTDTIGQLRGIGGLASRPSGPAPASGLLQSAAALTPAFEKVKGPWMRQLTIENPGR